MGVNICRWDKAGGRRQEAGVISPSSPSLTTQHSLLSTQHFHVPFFKPSSSTHWLGKSKVIYYELNARK